jgi:beta-ribofuranosylaminobenzene 5'-phosphate synthase
MSRVTVSVGARIHAGFCNLSLARERLYGGVGFGLEQPRVTLSAEPADGVHAPDGIFETYARQACEILDVPGADVDVKERLPRHVGLGSGTQTALSTYTAIARAHDQRPTPREHAPALGRGGRSGVGVATFERGGFILDAGQPSDRFTEAVPQRGDWQVPPVSVRHELPERWRVVLVIPDATPGLEGETEEQSMRSAVRDAESALASEISALVVDQLLPSAAKGNLEAFGTALATYGRLNGSWYTTGQDGAYSDPSGRIIERLADEDAVAGAGQSSWGPAVWILTDKERAAQIRTRLETSDDSGSTPAVRSTELAPRGHTVTENG